MWKFEHLNLNYHKYRKSEDLGEITNSLKS